MNAPSSSDHSIHIVIVLLFPFNAPDGFPDPLAGFAFDGVPDLLFEIGLCVVVFMTRNHDCTTKSIMFKFPMRPLSASDLMPSSGFQILY